MLGSQRASVIHDGQGRLIRFPLGNEGEVKASSSAEMRFGFLRSYLPPGAGMPLLHVHHSIEEAFYVMQGEVECRLGDRYERVGAGAAVLIPAGVPHCFRHVGEVPATLVVMTAGPEGIDMIAELSEHGQGSPERFAEILARYDSELLEHRPHWS
jgi:mannose-6-phosphate isomerase-like protein (cupin superfamily)